MKRIFLLGMCSVILSACSSEMLAELSDAYGDALASLKTSYVGSEEMRVGDNALLMGTLTVTPEGETEAQPIVVSQSAAENDADAFSQLQMKFEFHGKSDCSDSAILITDQLENIANLTMSGEDEIYLVAGTWNKVLQLPKCSELTDGLYIKTAFVPNDEVDLTQAESLHTCKKVVLLP